MLSFSFNYISYCLLTIGRSRHKSSWNIGSCNA